MCYWRNNLLSAIKRFLQITTDLRGSEVGKIIV